MNALTPTLQFSALPRHDSPAILAYTPWLLVQYATHYPVVITNCRDAHLELASVGVQNVLVTVEGVNVDAKDPQALSTWAKARSKAVEDQRIIWKDRAVLVIIGASAPSIEDFAKSPFNQALPIEMLAQHSGVLRAQGATVTLHGELDPTAIKNCKLALLKTTQRPDYKEKLAQHAVSMQTMLARAERLATEHGGGMSEATKVLDKIMGAPL
jgi:hypothetical protein